MTKSGGKSTRSKFWGDLSPSPVIYAHGAIRYQQGWARDVKARDRDVDNFSRDETDTRRWYISRPSRDPDVETETTTLGISIENRYMSRTDTLTWCKIRENYPRTYRNT